MEIRHNGYVPKYAGSNPHISKALEDGVTAFGVNPSKSQVIRFLTMNPEGATSGVIAKELNLTYQTVLRHLTALEEQGVVICDTPPEERQGRRTPFRINAAERDRHVERFHAYLKGEIDEL